MNNTIPLKEKAEKKHRILITDDNPINAELLQETLEQIDKEAIVSYSGIEALNIIENEQIDLILLDIMMPEMSGFEVIEKLKKIDPESRIPVIFISALSETKDIVKGLDLGSYGYITKPYNIDELKARITNILRIKDLQDELRQEKDKFDLINKFSADSIILLDNERKIISCSEQFLKWMDKDLKSVQDQILCDLIAQNSLPNYNKPCSKDQTILKEFAINNNGKPRFIETNYSKIYSEKNEPTGYLLVLRDISNQKEIEKQKETFIATLTHDLKTPIRAEIRSLEMLLNGHFGKLTPDQQEIIKETLYSSKFMFNMVDTLLTGYKYDNGKVVICKEKTDINSLIKDCALELKYLLDEKGHQLSFEFETNELKAYIDLIEIKRLITNLLSNAISYTQNKGSLTISTKTDRKNAIVCVKDNGKGISKKQIPHLFDKYTSYSKKFRQVGTGLGLFISKQIVEAHNGNIKVESEENKGSTFCFTIPTNTN